MRFCLALTSSCSRIAVGNLREFAAPGTSIRQLSIRKPEKAVEYVARVEIITRDSPPVVEAVWKSIG